MTDRKIKILPSIYLLFVGLLMTSCAGNVVFTDSVAMPDNTWNLENPAIFRVPVDDTTSNNNINFTIRAGSSYPFRNLYLFVSTTSPEGKIVTDTLHYYLSNEKGEWYGKGSMDIHEIKLNYKTNVFFPVRGIYEIKVQHGMRTTGLKGVYDFGIRIEKTGK
ncbi:MAG: gliding motility lipoprotein GldH [Bacteroidales bacterium]|nr:gliding motility lipoprotein GldH [Bacteroidales bacterium]